MPSFIVGIFGSHENESFPIESEVSFGRDSSNTVSINDPSVSRRHCVVVPEEGKYLLRDLTSHNGTFVNGKPVREHVLEPGDQLTVGRSMFVFSLSSSLDRPISASISYDDAPLRLDTSTFGLTQDLNAVQVPSSRLEHDFESLMTVAQSIGRIRNSESMLWQLSGVLLEMVPAQRIAVLLGNEPQHLEPAFAWDKATGPGQPVRVSRTIVGRVVRDRRPVIINNVAEVVSSTSVAELNVQSVLCVPLATPDQLLGVIYMDSRHERIVFDKQHLHLLTAVAGLTALALENVRAIELLQRENEQLKAEVRSQFDMIGESEPMQKLYRFIAKVAPTDSNVLVHGESGTGKELVARAVHRNSIRSAKPFVAINCAALTESLLESELFGHEKGAFTGASIQKPGLLEVADGGTVFLDEIGELALSLQSKLLRVLQERELVRVGGTRNIRVNIRVVAATNRNLAEMVKEGKFREDLYFRLNVLSCEVVPLRKRPQDIPLLAHHFTRKYSEKCNRRIEGIANDAMKCLQAYSWPGNVRELENAIERAVVMGNTEFLVRDDLPEALFDVESGTIGGYHDEVAKRKKELIADALKQAGGSFVEAAKLLGVHPNYLHRLVNQLDLRPQVAKSAK